MKSEIFFVKSLEYYLSTIIKQIIENPNSLKSGKQYKNMKLRPREILGAFLICLVIRVISNQDWTVARDTENGDGIIWCRDQKRKSDVVLLEQVYVRLRQRSYKPNQIVQAINISIQRKVNKGKEYSKNRHLVIFLDVEGILDYQEIKRFVATIQDRFDSYWLFAPYSKKEKQSYIVFLLKAERDKPAVYLIKISNNFRSWIVKKIGKL